MHQKNDEDKLLAYINFSLPFTAAFFFLIFGYHWCPIFYGSSIYEQLKVPCQLSKEIYSWIFVRWWMEIWTTKRYSESFQIPFRGLVHDVLQPPLLFTFSVYEQNQAKCFLDPMYIRSKLPRKHVWNFVVLILLRNVRCSLYTNVLLRGANRVEVTLIRKHYVQSSVV